MGVHLDSLPHPLLGTRGPRRWSSTTQVSDSAGHSVQLGWAPKSLRRLSLLEMWRRHKVTVAKKKEKQKTNSTCQQVKQNNPAKYCRHLTTSWHQNTLACFNMRHMQPVKYINSRVCVFFTCRYFFQIRNKTTDVASTNLLIV